MDSATTWAQHHGAAAVDALIRRYPQADPAAIRSAAGRWHATENLAGFLAASADPLPRPCCDCVSTHGDDPAAWLSRWPAGAEWHADLKAHLCDGCAEERRSWAEEEPDPYDMPPYADCY